MIIKPSNISEKHLGKLCVVHFSTSGKGFTGHSAKHGLESSQVSTAYIFVGTIKKVSDELMELENCKYSIHTHDLSWSLGPRYSSTENYTIKRSNIYGRIVLNETENSNSVMQHLLKSNKSKTWNRERKLADLIKNDKK